MTDINLQTLTPDTSINDSAFLFGADSQATGTPSVYPVSTVRAHFVGAGTLNVASAKTLTASNTLTLAGTDGTTMTFPSTSATLARTDAGNTFTGSQTLSGGTITTDSPVINASQTWNAGGVTFTGLKLNATDTASASGSLLMDLQVGGTSKFSVSKAGIVTGDSLVVASSSGSSDPSITFGSNATLYATATLSVQTSLGNFGVSLNRGGVAGDLGLFGSAILGWGTGNSAPDTFLTRRGAANLRFGAADAAAPVAQTLSVQSVVAGTTNTAGANLTITGSQGTGTGAGGSIIFQVAAAGSSGSAQNALSTALTIGSDRSLTLTSNITMGTTSQLSAAGGAALASPADSVWQMRNNAGTDFNRLQFGGGTSAFPAIKRSSTTLQARLADDSAFASVQGKLTTETAYTAGAIVVTGYLTLYDSTGTAYRVPCVV